MDLSREWYRSEFVNQEMLEQHRVIEAEFTFYDAIANGNIDTNIYLFELSSVLSQEQNIFALETISLTFLQPII